MRSATTDFQETHRTTHTGTTTRCRTQRRNPSRPERPQPHPPHTQVPFIGTQPLVAEHRGGTHRVRNDRSRTCRTHRYLSSPAATTLHGKMQGFVLRLPPQNKAQAKFMQPLPVVPHKAVAEVSKIGNLQESLVVVNQGWQSEATDGLKGA